MMRTPGRKLGTGLRLCEEYFSSLLFLGDHYGLLSLKYFISIEARQIRYHLCQGLRRNIHNK